MQQTHPNAEQIRHLYTVSHALRSSLLRFHDTSALFALLSSGLPLVLARQRLLPSNLLLGFRIAVGDELVQERVRLALWVLVFLLLGSFDFTREVAGCLVVDVVLVVDLIDIS